MGIQGERLVSPFVLRPMVDLSRLSVLRSLRLAVPPKRECGRVIRASFGPVCQRQIEGSDEARPLLKRQNAARLARIEEDIAAINQAIRAIIQADADLAKRFAILTSIPGVSEITAAALIIMMPELGCLDPRQAASLAGLAPMTRQSGQWRGKTFIRGGRAALRQAVYMPALVATRFNPDFKEKYRALREAGKPPKVAITAIMRKLVILANALIRDGRKWTPRAS